MGHQGHMIFRWIDRFVAGKCKTTTLEIVLLYLSLYECMSTSVRPQFIFCFFLNKLPVDKKLPGCDDKYDEQCMEMEQ